MGVLIIPELYGVSVPSVLVQLGLFLPLVIAVALYLTNRRILDEWNLALRRERALVEVVSAYEHDEEPETARSMVAYEIMSQAFYLRRRRPWSRRAPEVGKPWSDEIASVVATLARVDPSANGRPSE